MTDSISKFTVGLRLTTCNKTRLAELLKCFLFTENDRSFKSNFIPNFEFYIKEVLQYPQENFIEFSINENLIFEKICSCLNDKSIEYELHEHPFGFEMEIIDFENRYWHILCNR